jgi:predicted ArsR family transcriptional regulator
MDLGKQAARVGALADPTRRALYRYVCRQPEAVGRDEAAAGVGVARPNASFHLDRLVAEGLLEVEYRRLSGRTGPGAGRPSKLYRRTTEEVAVSLPPRRYDLMGAILAAAVGRVREGELLDDALAEAAWAEGADLVGTLVADGAAGAVGGAHDLAALATVLEDLGFEAAHDAEVVVLGNCPFDTLAQRHTELVCGVNRSFVQGVADGLGCRDAQACLEPDPPACCVKVRRRETTAGSVS